MFSRIPFHTNTLTFLLLCNRRLNINNRSIGYILRFSVVRIFAPGLVVHGMGLANTKTSDTSKESQQLNLRFKYHSNEQFENVLTLPIYDYICEAFAAPMMFLQKQ